MIKLNNVAYYYPFEKIPAVKNINFSVSAGEIVLCTGESGCGKTTLVRLLNGLCPHYFKGSLKGKVFINGIDTSKTTAAKISSYAGTLFQDPEHQFFAINTEDELAFALEWKGYGKDEITRIIKESSDKFGISDILGLSVYDLSEGQKQRVGLASAFARSPRILILDEPSANLDAESSIELAEQLISMKKEGIAVFVADHRLSWLRNAADRVIIMDKGEIAEEGDFSILENKNIREKYRLRSPFAESCKLEDCRLSKAPQAISAENIYFSWKNGKELFKGDSFNIPEGITAITGRNGAGKTTLARLITGLTKLDSGRIIIKGINKTEKNLFKHTALVLQNAEHGLYMRTVEEEIRTCFELSQGKAEKKRGREEVINLLSLFNLERLAERHPQSLSGGEKQRLVIAAAFAKNPKVIILDEPTSGLDGANMERIASALSTLSEKGVSVLLITHDWELMKRICNRALFMPLNRFHK